MTNYYYNNSKDLGLTTIGEVDGGGSYEFDMVCVWQYDADKSVVWAADAGCSCPIPFDGVELRPLKRGHAFKEFTQALDNCRASKDDCRRLETKVRSILWGRKNDILSPDGD